MAAGEQRYLSFLLCLWPVKQNGSVTWRASLENPHTGERRGFASLTALMNFLLEQTKEGEDKNSKDPIHKEDGKRHSELL